MKRFIVSVLLSSLISSAFCQSMKTRKWRKSEIDSLSKAQLLFEENNFLLALPIYQQLQKNHPKEMYLKYVTGVAGLYRSDTHEQSLEFLTEVYEKNKKAPDIEYDLARANHYSYKFDEAIALLDKYLARPKLAPQQKLKAEQLKSYCNNAKLLVASPVNASIENIGDIVNTVNSEYVPVISSDESVMIFTYVGDQSTGGRQNAYNQPDTLGIFYEDVFITHKEGNSWVQPSSVGTNINTVDHDAAIAISNDGQKLFIFKDNRYDGGDLYISRLEGDSWSVPEKLKGDVNTGAWEGSASLSSDERKLYFASEAASGFGGRDLYSAELAPDGTWTKVKNLGSTINTALDDDAPFIHPDGKTLI
jgi:tetratricopeptide (TPR) repeat protein